MICNHCGYDNPDQSGTCQQCGAPLGGASYGSAPAGGSSYGSAPAGGSSYGGPSYGSAPAGGSPYGNASYGSVSPSAPGGFGSGQIRPSTAAIKELAGSTIFLVATILFSVNILLNIIAAVSGNTWIATLLTKLLNQYSNELYMSGVDPSEVYSVINTATNTSIFSAVLSEIFPILVAVSLWITYTSGKKDQLNGTGLTIIKVLKIISTVAMVLCYLLAEAFVFIMNSILNEYTSEYGDVGITKYFLIVAAVVLIAAVITIVYYVKMIGSISAAQKAIDGNPNGKFSTLVAVLLFISAILGGLVSIICSITSLFSLLAAVCSAVSTFMFAMILMKAKNKMASVQDGSYVIPEEFNNGAAPADRMAPSGYANQNVNGSPMSGAGQNTMGGQNPYGSQMNTQNPYGSQMNKQAQNPYGSQMNGQAQNPYGSQMNGQAQNPYGSQMNGQAQNPYGSQMNGQAQNPFASQMSGQSQNAFASQMSGQSQNPFASQMSGASLSRTATGETFQVNTFPYLIGKGSKANLNLSDNNTVSHAHATIQQQNGQYYLTDNNSTNHTYLNGNLVTPNTPLLLSNADRITVATEELVFHC